MEELKTIIGFADGYFFVGQKSNDVLIDCLAIVFSNNEKSNGINLVNPMPFTLFSKMNPVFNGMRYIYIPKIEISKFLYTIDLKDDIEDGDEFINYYKDSLWYELTKAIGKEENTEKGGVDV